LALLIKPDVTSDTTVIDRREGWASEMHLAHVIHRTRPRCP